MNRRFAIAFVLSIVLTLPSVAAWRRTSGAEEGLWTTDRYSVIVGTVSTIKKGNERGRHEATLRPRAAIAGSFDCAAYSALPVVFYVDTVGGATGLGSSIREVPPEGATVLAVVQFTPKGEESAVDAGFIVSDLCEFMPDGSALCIIKGLEDAVVQQTLQRIREARRVVSAAPPDAPTTGPTGGARR